MLRQIAFGIINSILAHWERHTLACLIQCGVDPLEAPGTVRLSVALRATEEHEWTWIELDDSFGPEDMATLEDVAGKLVEEAWEMPAVPAGWMLETAGMGRDQ